VLLFLVCVPAGKCNTAGKLPYRGSVRVIPYPYPYGYGVGGCGYGVDLPTRGYTRAIPYFPCDFKRPSEWGIYTGKD
jgi:hypothetical protein